MPASIAPMPVPASKRAPASDVMASLLAPKSDSTTASSHSVSSGGTSDQGQPLRIDNIDDSYRSYADWSQPSDIDSSTRSDLEMGKLDTSARSYESHGGKKKYLTFGTETPRKVRVSLPDISGLPTLRESIEAKQGEMHVPNKAVVSRSSSFVKSERMSLSTSWRRSSFKLLSANKDSAPYGKRNAPKLARGQEFDQSSLLPTTKFKWWHGIFFFSLISVLACIITLWAPYPYGARMPSDMVQQMPWSDGCKDMSTCICPRETICADDLLAMILLTISRCSAWFDYPLYMCLYLTKLNNVNNFLQKTVLRCWINFSDNHKVHRLFGIIVGIESASHSCFHILRWMRRNDDIKLLWTSQTGITGLIALITSSLIILPMTLKCLRKSMTYEWRKGLHYLSIVWAVALMCHAPQRIFWMIGVPLLLYLTDKAIEIFSKTFLIESAHFERLSDSICTITFENPPGFGKQNSAYVYLMLPWISKYQFHAFTVFPGNKPNTSSICINKCGNWTVALMKEITTPTHRPAFVMGPYLSPFSSPAMDSENLVAVASGIGVTPAISLIKQYSCTTRRMNLIWICRDAALVEHFLQSLEFGINGHLLIYYTGKRALFLNEDLPPNVCIFNGRPNLERTISGVIYSIANDEGLPDELFNKNSIVTKGSPEISAKLILVKALSIYSIDQLFDYAVRASELCNDELPPWPAASFDGVLLMIDDLFSNDCELLRKKAIKNLDLVDSYGSSLLNKDMFEDFMQLMMGLQVPDSDQSISSAQDDKRSFECMDVSRVSLASINETISHGKFGIKKILHGDGKYSSKKWNMLYCGGSDAVLAQLKAYKHKYSIGLSVEKFDW